MSYNKKFPAKVSLELRASINAVLTWSLTSWFFFTGLFFTLKSPYLAQKIFFKINFIRILWFIWDLGLVLFDSHKNVVSGKKFGFWQYFGFSGGKLSPKIDQNYLKIKFQTNLTTFQWVTSKKSPRSSLKLYFLLVWYENIWNFKTW